MATQAAAVVSTLFGSGQTPARRRDSVYRLIGFVALALLGLAAPASAADFQQPEVRISADGTTASMRLDVLTYNLEGIPRRAGRKAQLQQIGAHLAALRKAGAAPDIVLFQEAFSGDAQAAVRAAGYPALVTGPNRSQQRSLPSEGDRRGHIWTKGELGMRLVGSGLAVASVYPIEVHAGEPFSRRACAGFDCLSNKGGLFARVSIPGVPDDLDLFGAHLNAQRSSGVAAQRHLSAHQAQVRELARFIDSRRDANNPVILAGDFNMRRSPSRFSVFEQRQPLSLVHRYCVQRREDCDVRVAWNGETPWMDTQDLQLFNSGARVKIRPVRVEALFDGRPDSPKLSDHDGVRVIYELSWPLNRPAPMDVAASDQGGGQAQEAGDVHRLGARVGSDAGGVARRLAAQSL